MKKNGEERLDSKSATSNMPDKNSAGANATKPDVKVQTEIDKKDAGTKTQPEASKETSGAKVQFKSDNIGRWASKQENPFAEQNRKTAAKKQQQAEQRKKAAPFVVVVVSIVAVVAAVCGLVFLIIALINSRPTLPDDLTMGSDGAAEISNEAQSVYDEYLASSEGQSDEERLQGALEAAKKFFNSKKGLTTNESVKTDLQVLEMQLYNNNAQPQAIIDMSADLNFDAMNEEQRGQCYSMLLNAAVDTDNTELSQYYMEKILEFNGSIDAITPDDDEWVEG